MEKVRTLIVGYGTVGRRLSDEIKVLGPDIADLKFEGRFKDGRKYDKYDVIFICVDTPYKGKDNPCDLSAVKDAVKEWLPALDSYGAMCIKSTMLPGSTERLSKEFKIPLVYSPEYYGDTPHSSGAGFGFTILSGWPYDCLVVQQALQRCHDASHSFVTVGWKVAELAKYMENAWLAYKVSFCSQFLKISKACNVRYEELRELFIRDPRVNPSHTFMYRDAPYWQSHCLDKDVRAIAESYDAELLLSMIEFNENMKKEVEGAPSAYLP